MMTSGERSYPSGLLADEIAERNAWAWVKTQAEAGAEFSVHILDRLYAIELEVGDGLLMTDYLPTIAEAVAEIVRLRKEDIHQREEELPT